MMSIAPERIKIPVRAAPSAEIIGQISIKSDPPPFANLAKPYRFMVVKGGRQIWQQWFDVQPIYVDSPDGITYQVEVAAFPTNPKEDYGYIRFVREV